MIEPVDSCLRTVTGEHAPIHRRGQLQLGIGLQTFTIRYSSSDSIVWLGLNGNYISID